MSPALTPSSVTGRMPAVTITIVSGCVAWKSSAVPFCQQSQMARMALTNSRMRSAGCPQGIE